MIDKSRPRSYDYSKTLYLPKTDFPMRASLPQREPDFLARWNEIGLYERLRKQSNAHARGRFSRPSATTRNIPMPPRDAQALREWKTMGRTA